MKLCDRLCCVRSGFFAVCLGIVVPALAQYFEPFPTLPALPGPPAIPVPLAPPEQQPRVYPIVNPTNRIRVTNVAPARSTMPSKQESAFSWDALVKETTLKPNELNAHFTFSLTNMTTNVVTINAVHTSCGCTVAKLPTVPWRFDPGQSGTFDVDVDARGKFGVVTKTVSIESSAGYRYLTLRLAIPGTSLNQLADRARNMQVALANRQSVFRPDCAVCHVAPGLGKQGEALFHAVCGVCHEAVHRATMVPDLRALHKPQDRDYWEPWIRHGKDKTLMPAWAAESGGPLNSAQIESLIAYLTGPFRTSSPPARPASTAGEIR
jgi:mono/diheme cytochrome c family protein